MLLKIHFLNPQLYFQVLERNDAFTLFLWVVIIRNYFEVAYFGVSTLWMFVLIEMQRFTQIKFVFQDLRFTFPKQ